MTVRVGVSGWSYRHWRGRFYPSGLPASSELAYAAERFTSIEINRTFYSLASPSLFRRWYLTAPPGFEYAVKGSRFITHNLKLEGVESALANFCASGLLELKEKLGPILWQLSPRIALNAGRLESFLALLPADTLEVAAQAASHTLPSREVTVEPRGRFTVRHALELRHPSFLIPEVVELARRHRVALAFSHSSQWPYIEEITAGFVYLRLHGPGRLYASRYTAAELRQWSDRIHSWARGEQPPDARGITGRQPPPCKTRDVYVYFDNDASGYAPRQALQLARIAGTG
ncbi:MAG TPA: DUF72 domain-containing protein [Acidimicrobiia bacterium]|nr:DUF72 domain-containing protein [Acidimicrobiia bacterium]